MEKRKNNILELYRGFFTIIIVIMHFHNVVPEIYINKGYLGVEFFFAMSGYFLAVSFEKKGLGIKKYFLGRISRLWPQTFLALICCSLIYTEVLNKDIWKMRFLAEALMVQEWGIFTNLGPAIVPQCWYISALLLASIIIYTFLNSFGWNKMKAFMLVGVVVGYSFLFSSSSGIEMWGMMGPFSLPVVRAFCGMTVGVIIYYIKDLFDGNDKYLKIIVRCGEIFSYIILIMTFIGVFDREEMAVACIFFLLFAAVTQASWLRSLDNFNFNAISIFSFPMYLNHILIMHIYSAFKISNPNAVQALVLYLAGVFVYTLIFLAILMVFRKIWKSIKEYIIKTL